MPLLPFVVFSIGLVGVVTMLSFRSWEIARGRENAARDRREEPLWGSVTLFAGLRALVLWAQSLEITSRAARVIFQMRAECVARWRFLLDRGKNTHAAFLFREIMEVVKGRGKMHREGTPSPFIQNVVEHKGALPADTQILD